MRQEDFVRLELDGVTEDSVDEVDTVQCVILQGVSRIGRHRLVVPVDLVQGRVWVVGNVRCGPDDDLKSTERFKIQTSFLSFFIFHRVAGVHGLKIV